MPGKKIGGQKAMAAALQATQDCYGRQMAAVVAEIQTLAAGRPWRSLSGVDALAFMALRARFDALAVEQQHFAKADLAHRLGDENGSEPV